METLSLLVQERNARETLPFAGIHGANALLWKQADAWQTKCLELEQKLVAQQESRVGDDADDNNAKIQYAESAALKNERKMREDLDRLKAQVKAHEERHQKDSEDLRDANQQLSELKDLCKKQEQNLSSLTEKNEKQDKALEHLSTQVSDSEQRANLAEQQCVGLKDAIRMITEESSNVRKENEQLTTRFIEEKQRLSSEVNTLNEMLEKLRKESAELQTVKKQEEKRKSWFGFSTEDTTAKTATTAAAMKSSEISARQYIPNTTSLEKQKSSDGKKNPPVKVVVPSLPKQIIQAHRQEAACVRCTTSGTDRIATGGSFDGTVQVWNVTDGSILATLRGGYNNSITTVDITNRLVVGGGNDKTCRVWDIDTQRMLHQLVGHAQKITCVRFLANGQGVVTAAKDRQIKVWDISKQTYRQKTNIVLDSTANAVDVASDSFTLVSGHTNGSLRFWDIRTGEKNGEIASACYLFLEQKINIAFALQAVHSLVFLFSLSLSLSCSQLRNNRRQACTKAPSRQYNSTLWTIPRC